MAIIGEIRKRSGLAVGVVFIALAAFVITDFVKRGVEQPELGEIDGKEINYGHFNELVTQRENLVRQQQNGQITTEQSNQIREEIWVELIENTLTQQEYDALGLRVTSRELSDMYLGDFIHPYLRQQFTDPATGVYNAQGVAQYVNNFDQLSPEEQASWMEMEKAIKTAREQEKYNSLIAKGFYIPNKLAEKVAEMEANSANVRVVSLPYGTISTEELNLKEEDYKKYYEAHKNEYVHAQDACDLDFIVFPVTPSMADLTKIQNEVFKVWDEFQTVDNSEIAFFVNAESEANRRYDSTFVEAKAFPAPFDSLIASSSVNQFFAPQIVGSQWMMSKVLKIENRPDSLRASVIVLLNNKIDPQFTRTPDQTKALTDSIEREYKAGRLDFDQAVMAFSDDPSKAQNTGDMGWALDGGYGLFNENIIATSLNDIFVFERPDNGGYHIVKVTGKTPAKRKYRVATIVRDIVPSDETARMIYANASKFVEGNPSHTEMLAAAQEQNLMVRNADFTPSNAYSLPGIANARSIVQWAFNSETEIGSVAPQVFDADDMYIVAALKDIRKKGIAPYTQVRKYIENEVRIDKEAEILVAKANEAINSTKDINVLASKLQSNVDSVSSISFNSYSFGRFGAENRALGAVAATKGAKLLAPVKGGFGVYVIQVDNVSANPTNVAVSKGRMEMESQQKIRYIKEALKDKIKIKDNRVTYF
jgi:peptidyl-prolyl cis-trans isomerase D